jgi:hypothetical protein
MSISAINLTQVQCHSQTTDDFNLTGNLNGTQISEIPMNWLGDGNILQQHRVPQSAV